MANITLLEKYSPKSLDDLFLPVRIRKILDETMQSSGYRLLFYSTPGTGKTTTAHLMSKGHQVLYLSGSNEFRIDTYRNKILPFSTEFSVLGKEKSIIIDECENIRDDLQDAFKILFDQCKKINFIFITNEVEKVNSALKSRCTSFDYNFVGPELEEQKKNFIKFALDICKNENIKYDTVGIKKLFQLDFPDFRHLLVHLQSILYSGDALTEENIKKLTDNAKANLELYKLIEDLSIDGKTFYEELTKFKGKEKECFLSLGEPYFEYLNSKEKYEKTLESAIIVDKYSNLYTNSIGKFTTFISCIVELKSLFK